MMATMTEKQEIENEFKMLTIEEREEIQRDEIEREVYNNTFGELGLDYDENKFLNEERVRIEEEEKEQALEEEAEKEYNYYKLFTSVRRGQVQALKIEPSIILNVINSLLAVTLTFTFLKVFFL